MNVGSRVTPFDVIAQQHERSARAARLAHAAHVGVIVWAVLAGLDVAASLLLSAGRPWLLLALRGAGLILLLASAARLRSARGSELAPVVDLFSTACLGALASLACVEVGGVHSPLLLGVLVVLVGHAALLPDLAARSFGPLLAAASSYPLVMLMAAFGHPAVLAQLRSPAGLAQFFANTALVVCAALLSSYAGQVVARLRARATDGRSLSRYRLEKRLGIGGAGEVWQAWDRLMARHVAIKWMRPERQLDAASIARFEREVRAMAQLRHPNTVRVFDYGVTEEGIFYYTTELLPGEDLAAIVARGRLPAARAVHIAAQVCSSLAEAHRLGLVHRDVKPGNVFVARFPGRDEEVRVLDFGIALVERGQRSRELTRTGKVVGTPQYVAPEAATGRPADARSDVYGVGALLYELLTGRAPFDGVDPSRLLADKLSRDVTPPSRRVAGVPPELERVVLRCLERDPGRRYPDVASLLADLGRPDAVPDAARPSEDVTRVAGRRSAA